jgi:hypothetical protein
LCRTAKAPRQSELPLSVHTFEYTGGEQKWIVPNGVTSVNLNAAGAQGTNALGGDEGATLGSAADDHGPTLNNLNDFFYFNAPKPQPFDPITTSIPHGPPNRVRWLRLVGDPD